MLDSYGLSTWHFLVGLVVHLLVRLVRAAQRACCPSWRFPRRRASRPRGVLERARYRAVVELLLYRLDLLSSLLQDLFLRFAVEYHRRCQPTRNGCLVLRLLFFARRLHAFFALRDRILTLLRINRVRSRRWSHRRNQQIYLRHAAPVGCADCRVRNDALLLSHGATRALYVDTLCIRRVECGV